MPAAQAMGTTEPGSLHVFITQEALKSALLLARKDPSVQSAGFLLGRTFQDCGTPFVEVTVNVSAFVVMLFFSSHILCLLHPKILISSCVIC